MASTRWAGGVGSRRKRGLSYGFSLALVVTLLALVTGTFVLIVLPQRFILHAGLREAGYNFPSAEIGFAPLQAVAVTPGPFAAYATPVGPAEAFWDQVGPLLEEGQFEQALPLFAQYLRAHPREWNVWREYASTLAAAGRLDEAAAALERYVKGTGDFDGRLQLARLLRDLGRSNDAIALYRDLLAERPDDVELRAELASALAWAGRYDEAVAELRRVVEAAPDATQHRLALARVLYWAGRLAEVLETLDAMPDDVPEAADARRLRAEVTAQLALPVPAGNAADTSARGRARAAAAAGDQESAMRLYGELLAADPRNPDLWLEWADVLQYELNDAAGARAALERYLALRPDDIAAALRLAQLHAWDGNMADAERWLHSVLRRDPSYVEAWRLLGDIRRWQDNRVGAARAYREALQWNPDDEGAAAGLAAVEVLTDEAIARRDPGGVISEVHYFGDTDEFRRWMLRGEWTGRASRSVITARAGVHRLEGPDGVGAAAAEGAFGEMELARWWREGTVRAAVRAGAERLDGTDVEPRFGLSIELPEAKPVAVAIEYDRGPAHPMTVTLGSALSPLTADRFAVSVFRPVGKRWMLWGSGEGTAVHGAGSDNVRLSGAVALARDLGPNLRGGLTSGVLGYSEAAPTGAQRPLYWDPEVSWSNGVFLELVAPARSGWWYRARLAPGLALVRERRAGALQAAPQVASELGAGFTWSRASVRGEGFYLLGRDGAYSAYGVNLRFTVTP